MTKVGQHVSQGVLQTGIGKHGPGQVQVGLEGLQEGQILGGVEMKIEIHNSSFFLSRICGKG